MSVECTLGFMNSKQIVFSDGTTHGGWMCTACESVWGSEANARNCCGGAACVVCGKGAFVVDRLCRECLIVDRVLREEELFRAAKRIRYLDYDGTYIYWSGAEGGGAFFRHKTELYAYCEKKGVAPPRWVFGCTPTPLRLDAAQVVAAGSEQTGPFEAEDLQTLQATLDAWVAERHVHTYVADELTVVLLDPSLYDQATWEAPWDPGDYTPYDAAIHGDPADDATP